jgi:hypothetical protein
MGLLNDRDQAAVRKEFEKLAGPVRLVVFSQELAAAELCRQNEELVREVAALAPDRITVEVLNLAIDRERAEGYGIDRVPATVVEGARDSTAALSADTQRALADLTDDVDIKVFSTPT